MYSILVAMLFAIRANDLNANFLSIIKSRTTLFCSNVFNIICTFVLPFSTFTYFYKFTLTPGHLQKQDSIKIITVM